MKDGSSKVATKESGSTLVEQLLNYGVTADAMNHANVSISVKQPSQWNAILSFLGYILPFVIVGVAFFLIFRQAQGSNNAAISFGKSPRAHVQRRSA
jgi:cell division protease FtsH